MLKYLIGEFNFKQGEILNEREEIIKKIKELQEKVADSKNNATATELAEYLVSIKKLEARLSVITEERLKGINKEKGGVVN